MNNSNNSITITNQLNEQDWVVINRTLMQQNPKKQRNTLLFFVGLFILATAICGYTWLDFYKEYEVYFRYNSALPYFFEHMIPALLFLLAPVIIFIKIKKYPTSITKATLKNPENKSFLAASTLTFSHEGISNTSQHTQGHVQWAGFVKIIDSPEFLMFFVAALQGYFIKKSIRTEYELQSIMALIQQNYKGHIITAT